MQVSETSRTYPHLTVDERAFWTEFAETTWERKTLSTADSPFRLHSTDDDVLLALASLAQSRPAATKDSTGLVGTTVSLDGNTVRVDRDEFLPQETDHSLQSYLTRVDTASQGQDGCGSFSDPDSWGVRL